MGSRYLSTATVIQLSVVTAFLALCLNLCTGLSAHEERLYQVYGDRVFSLRATVAESGSPYRFDQHDMTVIRDGLESEGIAVAGLSLSYIDAREVDPVLKGTSTHSHQLRTRIALADVTPLYFDIVDIPARLSRPDPEAPASEADSSEDRTYVTDGETHVADGGAYLLGGEADLPEDDGYLCVISQDLALGLFQGSSSVGHSVVVSGGKQLVVVDEIGSDHLLPIVDEPTPAGLVHRSGRFVIYRPLSDPSASANFEYLLFEIQGDVSLMDGMKSVSRFLTAHYPKLRSDVYSEYERFTEQSPSTRSALVIGMIAVIFGYVIAGIGVYAEMSHAAVAGNRDMAVRMMAGADPSSMAFLVFRRALTEGILAGVAGGFLYGAISAIGISLPALPPEDIGVRAMPAIISAAAAVVTASAAAAGPARRASAVDPSTGL